VGATHVGLECYVSIKDYSPWSNVIFAGSGGKNTVINGNVDICGSVHILGDGLSPSDLALNLSGGANINNNYDSMPPDLKAKVPPCPQEDHNGELIDSLDAELRVKRGKVGLSGASQAGAPNLACNGIKETLDGVYVTDGYGGNKGDSHVYADNDTSAVYDLGDRMEFPRLTEPFGGYTSYMEYLRAHALVISDPARLNELENITPTSCFDYADVMGKGSIRTDGKGSLEIEGIVYIAGDLGMAKSGSKKEITYTGTGSLVCTGDARIDVDVVTDGNDSFPKKIERNWEGIIIFSCKNGNGRCWNSKR
jgi:hypothetical protein